VTSTPDDPNRPDPAAPSDPVDRILLREAAELLGAQGDGVATTRAVVLDDITGALSVGAYAVGGDPDRAVGAYCDSLADRTAVSTATEGAGVAVRWEDDLDAALQDANLVLLRLPKSLAALDEIAEAVARCADPGVRVLAGGRVKHMSHGMNKVLLKHFGSVRASLGQQKSRVLVADSPRSRSDRTYPVCARDDDLDLTVCAHGAAFAGSSVDLGTRYLASFLAQLPETAVDVVDLGCGTGVLAVLAARLLPAARVLAVDESLSATRSALATARANDQSERVSVRQSDLLDGVPDESLDVVLCNPPFHRGTSRDSDVAFAMFADAARALRPGGELWTVFNTHLPYLPALRRLVGPTKVLGQNPQYLVTRSRRPPAATA